MENNHPASLHTPYPFFDLDAKSYSGILTLEIFTSSTSLSLINITSAYLEFSSGLKITYPISLNTPYRSEEYNVIFWQYPTPIGNCSYEISELCFLPRPVYGVGNIYVNDKLASSITIGTTNLITEEFPDEGYVRFHNYIDVTRGKHILRNINGTIWGNNLTIYGENIIIVNGLDIGTTIEDTNLQCPIKFRSDLVGLQGDVGTAGTDGLNGESVPYYTQNPDACAPICVTDHYQNATECGITQPADTGGVSVGSGSSDGCGVCDSCDMGEGDGGGGEEPCDIVDTLLKFSDSTIVLTLATSTNITPNTYESDDVIGRVDYAS